MVVSLLDLARLDAHALTPKTVILDPALVLERAAVRARRAGSVVSVEARRGRPILADEDLVVRLLDNLIANARRFASESPIELWAGEHALAVVDHGPGVPAREREMVFDRFYRGRRDEGEGTGLGLAICKGIMDAHHGSIRCKATAGGGATFLCTFPPPPPA
jgi:signal transduction histidine kinase